MEQAVQNIKKAIDSLEQLKRAVRGIKKAEEELEDE